MSWRVGHIYLPEPFDLAIFFFVSTVVSIRSPFFHIYGVIAVAAQHPIKICSIQTLKELSKKLLRHYHYYRNTNLSRLGNPCFPGFPTGNARPGQKRGPFVPGLPTGTKGAASATWLAHPFVPEQKIFFFLFSFSQFFLYFNYTFAFQLNLCIGIQCVWSPLIYTYIYSYLYNICPR